MSVHNGSTARRLRSRSNSSDSWQWAITVLGFWAAQDAAAAAVAALTGWLLPCWHLRALHRQQQQLLMAAVVSGRQLECANCCCTC